jgi:nitroreductase
MTTPLHPPNRPAHVNEPYALPRYSGVDSVRRAAEFAALLSTRRSCRFFNDEPVPRELVLKCVETANFAPSGANRQPCRFVIVDDVRLKCEIRKAAEQEEKESYESRMPDDWLDALEPIGTDWRKPFLETAPYLVVIFRVDWEKRDGVRLRNYYVPESVGIAAGFFLAACHNVGLATLTHTPNPMGFLSEILGRPANEKPYLLIPVGYPAGDAVVPRLTKKKVGDVSQFNADNV